MERIDDATLPNRFAPGDVHVAILYWPEEHALATDLSHAGAPKLLLVAPSAPPPGDWDVLTDWIRLPAEPREIQIRAEVLRRRAHRRPHPHLDDSDLAWRGDVWVALSPVEARLLAPLLERPGRVFSRRQLSQIVWPDGISSDRAVDSYVRRLRRRIPELGLAIHTVHKRGYFLAVTA